MIERRPASPWVLEQLESKFVRLRQGSLEYVLARLEQPRSRTSSRSVPWGLADTGRIVGWTIALSAGAICGFFLFRLLLSFAFLFGEGLRIIPVGSYDRLGTVIAPYGSAIMALCVGGAVCSSLLYAVYRHTVVRYHVPLSSLGFRRLSARAYVRIALLFVPVALAGFLLTRLQALIIGGAIHNPQVGILTQGMSASSANFVMLSILLIVLSPLAEETFFRGFLLTMLRQRMPSWAAISVSAAAFAALHGVPVLFPWLFFMGVVFGVVVEKTGSIYSSMLLHAMANTIATLSIVVAVSGW
ncbi:MAG: putative amino terminal protease family protein [Chloroflexi bacterium]|nr:putative amino terminal protease family protein [Chloroflexota bacterium]